MYLSNSPKAQRIKLCVQSQSSFGICCIASNKPLWCKSIKDIKPFSISLVLGKHILDAHRLLSSTAAVQQMQQKRTAWVNPLEALSSLEHWKIHSKLSVCALLLFFVCLFVFLMVEAGGCKLWEFCVVVRKHNNVVHKNVWTAFNPACLGFARQCGYGNLSSGAASCQDLGWYVKQTVYIMVRGRVSLLRYYPG